MDGGPEGKPVIFLSCDVVAPGRIDRIVDRVTEADPTIPPYAVIQNTTHTHSSIPTGENTPTDPDGREIYPTAEIGKVFEDQAVAACLEAWRSRKPGGVAFGYGYAVVAQSRRVVYNTVMGDPKKSLATPVGKAVMYGKTDRPEFSHYEAGADHFLNLLFTLDENDRLTGMIVNVPCPSQVGGGLRKISADYWTEVREGVAKEFGPDVYVLPQCGAAGDLSPRLLHYQAAEARRYRLKYGLDKGISWNPADPAYLDTILARRRDIAGEIVGGIRDVVTAEEAEECRQRIRWLDEILENGTPEEKEKWRKNGASARRRNLQGIARFEKEDKEDPFFRTKMHVVRIGDAAFATCRFELYMDFMHRLQARSPFLQTFLVQLAGEAGGSYLATERARESIGYSASLFCNKVSPAGGQQLVEEALKSLNEMKAKDETADRQSAKQA